MLVGLKVSMVRVVKYEFYDIMEDGKVIEDYSG